MILKPPANLSTRNFKKLSVFLAGSIEMGKAEDWQTDIGNILSSAGYNVFNPRREDWNKDWDQKYENPQFYQQVNWELEALEKTDHIIMHIDPTTLSPVTLIEFGMYVRSGKLIVSCPNGFWRKGNIDIVCSKYDVPLFDNLILLQEFLLSK